MTRAPLHAQDPRQRIKLPRIMKHPWVTKQGAWPLATLREMGGRGGSASEDAESAAAVEDCLLTAPGLLQLPDLMSTSHGLDVPREVRARACQSHNFPECHVAVLRRDLIAHLSAEYLE